MRNFNWSTKLKTNKTFIKWMRTKKKKKRIGIEKAKTKELWLNDEIESR